MLARIAIATITFAGSFCGTHFYSKPGAESPRDIPIPGLVPQLSQLAPSAPVDEIVTTRGLLDAAAGRVRISPENREHLRFGDWAKRDPEAAFAAALEHEDASIASTVITSIAEVDPFLALELAKANDGSVRTMHGFYHNVFQGWPEVRLAEAVEAVLDLKKSFPGKSRYDLEKRKMILLDAAREIAIRWPEHDTANLLQWASQLHAGDSYGGYELIALLKGREFDHIAVLASIEDDDAKAVAATYIASLGDIDQGLLALALVPAPARAGPVMEIAENIAEGDTAASLRFLEEHFEEIFSNGHPARLADQSDFDFQMSSLGRALLDAIDDGSVDVSEFPDLPIPLRKALRLEVPSADEARWISTIPDSPDARGMAADTVAIWATDDSAAASEWLGTLEAGAIRDHAIASFVRELSKDDPAPATAWAAEITDRPLRERFLRVALRRWKAADEQAATAAISGFGLSAIAVESLMSK